jgi:ADP-heptose:LPS heptosyltransferase
VYEFKVTGRDFNIEVDKKSVPIKSGRSYIVPNHMVQQLQSNPNLTFKPFINEKELKYPIDYTGKKLLVSRTGGRGDWLFILRSLREIKKNFRNVYIEARSAPRFESIISTFFRDVVDVTDTFFIGKNVYDKCDYFFTFENYIELNPIAENMNAFDMMSKKFFIDIGKEHTMRFEIPEYLKRDAGEIRKDWERPVVGLQVKASAILRTLPFPEQVRLIKMLGEKGYDTLLLDRKENIETLKKIDDSIVKYIKTPYSDKIASSFDLSVALATYCSAIIAPDSIFVYIGDSFDIPTIGIYSPFESRLRAEGLKVYAIEMTGGCSGCHVHSLHPCKWTHDTWSPCLKNITAEHLMLVLEEAWKKK